MKTNTLPQSVWSDLQAAGSQSQQTSQSNPRYLSSDNMKQTGSASNDAKYHNEDLPYPLEGSYSRNICFAYKRFDNSLIKAQESTMTKNTNTTIQNNDIEKPSIASGYKKVEIATDIAPTITQLSDKQIDKLQNGFEQDNLKPDSLEPHTLKKDNLQKTSFTQGNINQDMNNLFSTTSTLSDEISGTELSGTEMPERVFMNGLIKHTGIALAIIIPLAAFSAYADAAPMIMTDTTMSNGTTDRTTTATLTVEPSSIIHKSASTPTTVDSVDLEQYADS